MKRYVLQQIRFKQIHLRGFLYESENKVQHNLNSLLSIQSRCISNHPHMYYICLFEFCCDLTVSFLTDFPKEKRLYNLFVYTRFGA